MSGPNRIEVDEKLQHDARICRQGVDTDFWKLVKRILTGLSDQARDELVFCEPSEVAQIAQRQAVCRAVQQLITVVESTATLQ